MAHPSIPEPEPDQPEPESSARAEPAERMQAEDLILESDIVDLAAKFAAHLGGNLSVESSADLALEIVLNEIAQQACLATGANGAAVLLERDGEMECRASSGSNAPELGARLGNEPGLTAECIRTRRPQFCDDALIDPRADVEASRHLGVRSVMVLPLLRSGGDLTGVLEVFSVRPGAFGARDELTLQALAQRILKNLQRIGEPKAIAGESPELPPPIVRISETAVAESVKEDSRVGSMNLEEELVAPEPPASVARGGLDPATLALSVAVICVAVLLGTLVGVRLGWRRSASNRGQVSKVAFRSPAAARNAVQPAPQPVARAAAPGAGNSPGSEKKNTAAPHARSVRPSDSFPPPGGLSVYENGQEVFRMPPVVEPSDEASNRNLNSTTPNAGRVRRASSLETVDKLGISPEIAEESLQQRVEPDYPEEALRQRIQGAVVLDVGADRDGSVQEIKLLSGQPLLADAAIAAVKQWRFKPLVVKGQPVEMRTTITLNFRLPR